MAKKLFIGNLEWGATDADLLNLFSQYGTVEEAIIIKDRASGRSKGFGFVTFSSEEEAGNAISNLDGSDFNSRKIAVKEAQPEKPRTGGGGGFRRGGGGGFHGDR